MSPMNKSGDIISPHLGHALFLSPSPNWQDQPSYREAGLAQRLGYPGIVACHDRSLGRGAVIDNAEVSLDQLGHLIEYRNDLTARQLGDGETARQTRPPAPSGVSDSDRIHAMLGSSCWCRVRSSDVADGIVYRLMP
jgi:hypothetical protein